MPTTEEDRVITAAAKSDPEAQPLTTKQLKAMVSLRALRGRPQSESKKLLLSEFGAVSPETAAAVDEMLTSSHDRRTKDKLNASKP
jgi:hypothetical protein